MVRIAILDITRCKLKRCSKECYRFCPKVRSNIEAIIFEESKPRVVEALCIGCGICVKKCPFSALTIVNLPDELEKECSHRFGPNAFKLYRVPTPSQGVVLGLLGQNGIGKSTAIKILSSEIKPNLGNFSNPPEWGEITKHFRGSILQNYFLEMSQDNLRVVHKPQYVDRMPQVFSGKVCDLLEKLPKADKLDEIARLLQLEPVWDRTLDVLSGGELQRVAVAAIVCNEADVYLFDEPSSYLDVKQRLEVARVIRSLKDENKTVIVAEHDLAILDYLSDQICLLYGEPGAYGVVSQVHGVRAGINIYLQGFISDENVRFRKEAIIFHVKPPTISSGAGETILEWEKLEKSYAGFTLKAEPGEVKKGEVVGILGPNGIGKTTFVKLLAGLEKANKGRTSATHELMVSYKPQYISSEYDGSVEELLRDVGKDKFSTSWYNSEILQPLNVKKLLDRNIRQLSGGELQRVTIAACLSREAQLYLLDEPSAYLDVEERLSVARTIRRMIENKNATAFVVEHDVVAQDFIADRLMVFKGESGVKGLANPPTTLRFGMNDFLKEMRVTFRRDPTTRRPRVNKEGSRTDRYQRKIGEYYYIAETSK
ncbi:MAG: ribosome biogenesis/translation initiation ATPase RLI [Candidatus Bathyarchaeota archaeon]|nr:MAG: ribosome biogenesis/translation initiation ATPase RLI [Candidatus Bathyarchaeota archaeon]